MCIVDLIISISVVFVEMYIIAKFVVHPGSADSNMYLEYAVFVSTIFLFMEEQYYFLSCRLGLETETLYILH